MFTTDLITKVVRRSLLVREVWGAYFAPIISPTRCQRLTTFRGDGHRSLVTPERVLSEYNEDLIYFWFEYVYVSRLSFVYNPPSSVYNFTSYPLCEVGQDIELTLDNARSYIDLTLDFCFNTGLRKQMDALRGKKFIKDFCVFTWTFSRKIWCNSCNYWYFSTLVWPGINEITTYSQIYIEWSESRYILYWIYFCTHRLIWLDKIK